MRGMWMVRMVTVVNERAAMSIHSMRPQLRARVMLLQLCLSLSRGTGMKYNANTAFQCSAGQRRPCTRSLQSSSTSTTRWHASASRGLRE